MALEARDASTSARRRTHLAASWTASTVVMGGMVLASRDLGAESAARLLAAVLAIAVTNVALLAHLGRPRAPHLPDAVPVTRRRHLAALVTASVVVLFGAGLAGTAVLWLLAAVAAAVLVALHHDVGRQEVAYALLLGSVAAVGGVLEEGTPTAEQVVAGLLQLPLTVVTLLAGWALARREEWGSAGVGTSVALRDGAPRALRVGALAFLLALPWALSNIVNGPFEDDRITHWWQAVGASVRAGVAEEAWGRVFVIVALYVVLRRAATPDTALLTAAIVGTAWFAFIHTPANPVAALLLAALYGLPLTWLFLRRGLEAAIGFHLCSDLVRFAAAYVAFRGWWFT